MLVVSVCVLQLYSLLRTAGHPCNVVPSAIDGGILPLLQALLAENERNSTVMSCLQMVTEKSYGARSVLQNDELSRSSQSGAGSKRQCRKAETL
jgi:hypothetical protein